MIVYRENVATRRLRRTVDITLALLIGLIALPVVALACAAILLEDGRPVIFRQRRAGRFERMFTIYKLRTMKTSSCTDQTSPTAAGDQRITATGRWLRKTSIDELPQLLNVLRGDMSLIGPRPEMQFILRRYHRGSICVT